MDKRYHAILIICVGLIALYLFLLREWMVYAALIVGAISIISARGADIILKMWIGLGNVLGYINSRIILTGIFFLFLFPLSLLQRLVGNQTMMLKKKKGSYYFNRNHRFEKVDFEHPW